MFITKVKTAASCLLAFGFLTAGLGIAWQSTHESNAQASVQQDRPRDKDKPADRQDKPGDKDKPADRQDKPGDKERPQSKDGVTVAGKLTAISADSVTLEIVKRGEDATSKTFTLAKDAKIVRNGKDAKLADLKKGGQATLTLSKDRKTVVSISAADRGDPSVTPPR